VDHPAAQVKQVWAVQKLDQVRNPKSAAYLRIIDGTS
jgi:hypothetical protein